MSTLLSIRNLRIAFSVGGHLSVPVRDISFDIPEKGRVALVGESGSGKSLTALALGHLVDRARISGEIVGRPRLAYVFQNPMQSLNPVMRVGAQIAEAIPDDAACRPRPQGDVAHVDAVYRPRPQGDVAHVDAVYRPRPQGDVAHVDAVYRPRPQADGAHVDAVYRPRQQKIAELLSSVGLPTETAHKYPCQLSGGQQQRAMIAMALAAKPDLLVADEPTTALDVTTQKEVLDLIDRVADASGMAVLLITHNLGLVSEHARYVNVMYAGEIVEAGPADEVLHHPVHPYTKGLLAAVPRLDAPQDAPLRDIPGTVPPPTDWPTGCAFHPRCPEATEACRAAVLPRCRRAKI